MKFLSLFVVAAIFSHPGTAAEKKEEQLPNLAKYFKDSLQIKAKQSEFKVGNHIITGYFKKIDPSRFLAIHVIVKNEGKQQVFLDESVGEVLVENKNGEVFIHFPIALKKKVYPLVTHKITEKKVETSCNKEQLSKLVPKKTKLSFEGCPSGKRFEKQYGQLTKMIGNRFTRMQLGFVEDYKEIRTCGSSELTEWMNEIQLTKAYLSHQGCL